jgi:hypothetical protein
MNTFPAGSIGALITPDPDLDRSAPIAIPREFRARQSAPGTLADERQQRFVYAAVAIGVVVVVATVLYLAI